ncbi:hypothetical protein [Parvularcula sp. LCG005]|uniref:hypothetical protein n=1 Tax=Parvularcula sp. LCG005 TaxID=3078805 RepID=UPI002943B906|nr:hypothetical protein [Parvularcula sp. LCG005]WOI53947.1 hypothetical protein RUI03_02835 [Parvularcula sp. LCG005]
MKAILSAAVMAAASITGAAHAAPVNDLIENAIALGSTTTIIGGTTIDATTDIGAPFAGTPVTSPGVWYTTVGNGSDFTVSTCNAATFDTKISVYADYDGSNLSSLTPIAGQDDVAGCLGFTTEFDFLAEAGELYWILVHGFGGDAGNFDLTLTVGEGAEVPLPAAALLFVPALGGIIATRRKARAK